MAAPCLYSVIILFRRVKTAHVRNTGTYCQRILRVCSLAILWHQVRDTCRDVHEAGTSLVADFKPLFVCKLSWHAWGRTGLE